MANFSHEGEPDGRSGFLEDVDLAQLMEVIGDWGEREGGKAEEFLELFELRVLRENLSRFNYWSRVEEGVPRTSVSLKFTRSN